MSKTISDTYQNAKKLLTVLEDAGFESRLVGGGVRDHLLNLTPQDYDIATTALPKKVMAILSKKKIKSVPTGIDHGTITAIINQQAIEITTLRHDVKTDGRHAQVLFGVSFKEDALRRDFTINAMSEDKDGNIYDYFDGKKDLKDKKLRFVGNAKTRIKEDYLRILRFFRFQARFNFDTDEKTHKALGELKDGLKKISTERVAKEINLILESKHAAKAWKSLDELNILPMVFPSLEKSWSKSVQTKTRMLWLLEKWPRNAQLNHSSLILGALVLFVSLNDRSLQPKQLGLTISAHLKRSNKSRNLICTIAEGYVFLRSPQGDRASLFAQIDLWEKSLGKDGFKKTAYPIWRLIAEGLGDLRSQTMLKSLWDAETHFGTLRTSPLPLTTKEVIEFMQLKSGPEIGRIVKNLEKSYRNGLWTNRQQGLQLLIAEKTRRMSQ